MSTHRECGPDQSRVEHLRVYEAPLGDAAVGVWHNIENYLLPEAQEQLFPVLHKPYTSVYPPTPFPDSPTCVLASTGNIM